VIRSLLKQGRSGWEPARSAFVHHATRNRLVVVPSRIRDGRAIRVLDADVEPSILGKDVQAAIEDSERIEPNLDRAPSVSWAELLADVGLSPRQLAGRRGVDVDEIDDASLRVAAWRYVTGGWEPIGDHAEVTRRSRAPQSWGTPYV
jgi:hypothetical protein